MTYNVLLGSGDVKPYSLTHFVDWLTKFYLTFTVYHVYTVHMFYVLLVYPLGPELRGGSRGVRIDPLHFLAGCRTR